jgi:hypothetical protein
VHRRVEDMPGLIADAILDAFWVLPREGSSAPQSIRWRSR